RADDATVAQRPIDVGLVLAAAREPHGGLLPESAAAVDVAEPERPRLDGPELERDVEHHRTIGLELESSPHTGSVDPVALVELRDPDERRASPERVGHGQVVDGLRRRPRCTGAIGLDDPEAVRGALPPPGAVDAEAVIACGARAIDQVGDV